MEPRRIHRRPANEPGHAHEMTFSCYRKFPFLRAERTCLWLVDAIEQARARLDFAVWAYVFMPDHVHLLVGPKSSCDVATILKSIKGPVGRRAISHLAEQAPEWLPRITRRRGRRVERCFWQSGGGYDRNIWNATVFRASIDYIHANPVRKGLVERARDWRWSSAAWFEGDPVSPLVPDPIPPDWSEAVPVH
jgi:putative transposase